MSNAHMFQTAIWEQAIYM